MVAQGKETAYNTGNAMQETRVDLIVLFSVYFVHNSVTFLHCILNVFPQVSLLQMTLQPLD